MRPALLAGSILTFAQARWDALLLMKHGRSVKLMAALWLVTYIVCIGLVCSFILFEVLDIDGSDFPATPIKLAEPAHELKRAMLSSVALAWSLVAVVVVLLESSRFRCSGALLRVLPPPGPRGRRGLRMALPRASLADFPTSA